MTCTHTFKSEGDHMKCSKCGYVREFSKTSIKPKILVIGLIVSVMIVGAILTFSYFPKIQFYFVISQSLYQKIKNITQNGTDERSYQRDGKQIKGIL